MLKKDNNKNKKYPMINIKREEIKNKHGQYIAYWSKQKRKIPRLKFRNFRPDNIISSY
jgi:hypothetical protein